MSCRKVFSKLFIRQFSHEYNKNQFTRQFCQQNFPAVKLKPPSPSSSSCSTNQFYYRGKSRCRAPISKLCIVGASACALGLVWSGDSYQVHAESKKDFHVNFIADVVESAAPAVVNIEIKGRDPFRGTLNTISNGSGFIIRENGLIMTNAHVVQNQAKVVVKLYNGDSYEGTVTAVDSVSDLATIKINKNNLPTLKFGQSSKLRPGEFVVALGCPLMLSNSVTAGIVSSVHRGARELGMHNQDVDYVQTDAVITFGNSGGPLVNMSGDVIGINTIKVTTGIGLAISSDYASEFLVRAEKYMAKVERKGKGWFSGGDQPVKKKFDIGITMLTLSPVLAQELKERVQDFPDVSSGVFVYKMYADSPAHKGGIQPGDVITHINKTKISSAKDIYKLIENSSSLNVTVLRGRQTLNLTVRPEEVN